MAESNKEFFSEIKSEFQNLGSKVNKLFDELVHGRETEQTYVVAADVYETEEHVAFVLDLPGFNKSDVTVQIRDNKLVVKGARERGEVGEIRQSERRFGSFEQMFSLPQGVDQNQVRARFELGVLTITLPKDSVEVEGTEVNID